MTVISFSHLLDLPEVLKLPTRLLLLDYEVSRLLSSCSFVIKSFVIGILDSPIREKSRWPHYPLVAIWTVSNKILITKPFQYLHFFSLLMHHSMAFFPWTWKTRLNSTKLLQLKVLPYGYILLPWGTLAEMLGSCFQYNLTSLLFYFLLLLKPPHRHCRIIHFHIDCFSFFFQIESFFLKNPLSCNRCYFVLTGSFNNCLTFYFPW